ncbi:MAG: hypothetical protein ACN4GG_08385 [Akkermansiaceae bacterium]
MSDQQTPSPQSADSASEQARSPFAGCLILIVMAIVALVLVSSAGWALKKQTEAIAEFTEEEAKPTPVTDVMNHQTDFNSLVSRMERFEHEIENNRATELKLSPTDLNLAISHYEALEGFHGQLSVESISSESIKGQIHLPLNSTKKLPAFVCSILSIEQRANNLNGNYEAEPLLTDGSLIATLTKITPNTGSIPKEFLAGIARLKVSGEVQENSTLERLLKKLTAVELHEGALVFSYDPKGTPPSAQKESNELANKAKQFVALGGVIFILTMILAFIIISRWRKNRAAQAT